MSKAYFAVLAGLVVLALGTRANSQTPCQKTFDTTPTCLGSCTQPAGRGSYAYSGPGGCYQNVELPCPEGCPNQTYTTIAPILGGQCQGRNLSWWCTSGGGDSGPTRASLGDPQKRRWLHDVFVRDCHGDLILLSEAES
jgi:hypothetical protein